jgi:Xaa-Pro aminopeptidase
VIGEPDAELEDLLAEIETIQQAARRPIRSGARGGEIYAAAQDAMRGSAQLPHFDFLAHGMGLVSHATSPSGMGFRSTTALRRR